MCPASHGDRGLFRAGPHIAAAKDDMDIRWTTWCRQLESIRGPGVRMIARVRADIDRDAFKAFARAAASLGYVAVDAQVDQPEAARRRFWHRHVVLIHRGAPTPASLRWVRELARASPRAHAVVATWAPDRVHEDSPPSYQQLDPLPADAPGVITRRALRLRRRHRPAAARRWASAAVEHSRRAADELGTARAFAELTAVSETREYAAARRLVARGVRLLAGLDQLSARSHVAEALAGVWITQGEFEAATAALSAIDVECTLVDVEVPPWIRSRQAEVACWLGRWEDAEERAREARHPGWRGVAAFARRDWATVRTAVSAAGGRHAGWQPVLALLASSADGDRSAVTRCLESIRGCEEPVRWRDVLVLEGLRMAGADDEWERWKALAAARIRGPAEDVMWRWVTREAVTSRQGRVESPDDAVRRLGADGIRRWGVGRQTMQVWAGVLSLLQHVQEADDGLGALRQGCCWAREYAGVDGVAVVSADGLAVLACDPPEQRQAVLAAARDKGHARTAERTVAEPVRYGGVQIGQVVCLGPGRDMAECRAVAAALATACAPALRARLDELQVSGAGEALAGDLLGVSPAMRALRGAVARAAGADFPVLIEGESGTGKELVARALHRLSARRDRRWTAVNCAALTDELLEAELFGHTRGAFTGAMGTRVGLLEDAHEGTLFLDEIAELSPRAQAKLLRVLQEGEIRRIGENTSRRVDVRLVTATNRPLAEIARQGIYREDLMFRLAVIRLRVPPLRDRLEDVPVLAQAFWRTAASHVGTRALLAPDAVAALCRSAWPGNVRELQNAIAALAVGGPTRGRISARHVTAVLAHQVTGAELSPPVTLAEARAVCDRRVIAASLARHADQRAAAARELGLSRQGLAKLIARLDVRPVSAN